MSSSNPNNTDNIPMWIVTGTSSGLGLALSQHILRHKHGLISISRHSKPDRSLTSLAESSSSSTPRLHHIQIDLSSPDPESIKSPIRGFLSSNPTLDIRYLINNAGMTRFSPLETTSPASVFETMNTNFYSPLWVTQTVLPRLRSNSDIKGDEKVILNISSTQGLATDPSEVAYDASKHALEAMSKVLAAEVSMLGVRVIVANLGSFRTQFSGKGASTPKSSKQDHGDDKATQKDKDGKTSISTPTETSSGDLDAVYGSDHPATKRMEMVAKYSNIPNAARGDVNKGASVLFDAVMKRGRVNEILEKQRRWSIEKGDGKGRIERLVLGSDAVPKVEGVVEQFRMEVETSREILNCVDADDVKS